MDIDFDSELLWDVWYYFIIYGSTAIFGLSCIRKFLLYSSLKNRLGDNYKSVPDISKMKRWRKYLVILMLILAFFILLFTLFSSESFLYLLPVLFVTGIVYLNGKLKGYFWDTSTTFFYSEKGFCLNPSKNKALSFRHYKWTNVETVKIKSSSSTQVIRVKMKNKNGLKYIRNKKEYSEKIKKIFVEKGVAIE